MSSVIDARGLSCPQPVILTMGKIREMGRGRIEILVDTDTSRENVTRAARSKGWEIRDVQPEGTGYKIAIEKG